MNTLKNTNELPASIEITESSGILESRHQHDIFPVEITEFYPNDQKSCDLTTIGSGRNGKDYAIKRTVDGNGMIPASEFFCYELARQVNIATPSFDIVKLQGEELAFGSVWEGGVYNLNEFNIITDLLTNESPECIKVKSLDIFFGKVYAFDLFVNNIDRHFGNYIFRKSYSGYIGLAFDYSRAWYVVDYKGLAVIEKTCNTQVTIQHIKDYKKFNQQQCNNTLDDLGKIKQSTVKQILSKMPEKWMTKLQIEEIIKWWGSKEFNDRLQILKKEVSNVLV